MDKEKILSVLNLEKVVLEGFMKDKEIRNNYGPMIKMKIIDSAYNYYSAINLIGMATDFVMSLVEKETNRFVGTMDFTWISDMFLDLL